MLLFEMGEIGFYNWESTGCLDKNKKRKLSAFHSFAKSLPNRIPFYRECKEIYEELKSITISIFFGPEFFCILLIPN